MKCEHCGKALRAEQASMGGLMFYAKYLHKSCEKPYMRSRSTKKPPPSA